MICYCDGYIFTASSLQFTFAEAKVALKISQANYDRTAKKIKLTDTYAKEGRMAVTLLDYSTVSPPLHIIITALYSYPQGTSYVSVEGECKKSNLTGDIPGFGVPAGASTDPTGPKYIGSSLPNLGVFVYEYYGTDSEIGDYYVSYAPIGEGELCVPVLRSTASLSPLKEGSYE